MNNQIAPEWVQELTIQTLIDEGIDDVPTIEWWERPDLLPYSGGTCYSNKIKIRIGWDKKDQKLVLLHELAHWIADRKHQIRGVSAREMHSQRFWDIAFRLYRKHRLTTYGYRREKNYKKGAVIAYKKLKSKI